MQIHTFADFWPYYVRQHSQPRTRMLHAIGSVLAVVMVGMAFAVNLWFLLAAPLVGYSFAWYAHFFVEHNKPATFGHPFYSLAADYRMLFLMMAGRMDEEVIKHAVATSVPPRSTDRRSPVYDARVMNKPLLEGRTGIIFGVANKRSIAWAIAQSLANEGMRLAFTYQGERLKESVEALAGGLPGSMILPCDVTADADIDSVFTAVGEKFGKLDAVVHSVAFAPREDLENDFINTSRAGFKTAHDISAYSLVAISKAALPLMEKAGGGSILALTYLGATKAVEGYNVMGVAKASLEASVRYLAANLGPKNIRVNAISAGPVNTLAARGIKGFTGMLHHHAEKAPMRRNVELEEIGNAGLFLISPMGSGITGEIMFVDCGYNIVGL